MSEIKSLFVLSPINTIEEIVNSLIEPVELVKGKYSKLEFRIINNEISLIHLGKNIKEFTNVWILSHWGARDIAYAVNLYLNHHNTSHTKVEKGTSKITDQMVFALNGIQMPNTFFINNADITNYVETIESICGYPLIIKKIIGSGGLDSLLINNRKELIEQSKTLLINSKYMYQK